MSIIPSKIFRRNLFFGGILDTEYGIPAEFRKNCVSTEYRIPQYGIPYSAEFPKITEFRNIRNSVKMRNSVIYGIPYIGNSVKNTEFRNLIPAEFRKKIPLDTLTSNHILNSNTAYCMSMASIVQLFKSKCTIGWVMAKKNSE